MSNRAQAMTQFQWLLFPMEELCSTGNQTVTLGKTCSGLLITSWKYIATPLPVPHSVAC